MIYTLAAVFLQRSIRNFRLFNYSSKASLCRSTPECLAQNPATYAARIAYDIMERLYIVVLLQICGTLSDENNGSPTGLLPLAQVSSGVYWVGIPLIYCTINIKRHNLKRQHDAISFTQETLRRYSSS